MRTTVLTAVAVFLFAIGISGVPSSGLPARAAEPMHEPVYEGKPAGEWVKALNSGDAAGRERAARALRPAAAASPQAVAALVKALRDSEPRVRLAASDALAGAGAAAVPLLTQTLWDDDPMARGPAAVTLTRVGLAARPAAIPLARALHSDLPAEVRERIAQALVQLENYDVVPAVVPLLQDDEPLTRVLAGRVLAGLEAEPARVLDTYRAFLRDKNPSLHLVAVSDLAALGPEARPALPELVKRLGDKDARLRRGAAEALGAIGPGANASAPELVRVMKKDADELTRLTAAEAAWRVARPREVPDALRAMLAADGFGAKVRAAELLWWADRDPAAVKTLTGAIEAGGKDLARAAGLLARMGPDPAGAKVLGKWLDQDDETVRGTAAAHLGSFGDTAAPFVPRLKRMASDDKDPVNRLLAARSVWLLDRGPDAVDLFKPLLAHESVDIRRAGVARLASYPRANLKALAPALRYALKDPDGQVRVDAAAALWQAEQADDARTALAVALTDTDKAARDLAALNLGACLGPDARSAVPALVRALWDEEPQVRSTAAEALGRIGPAGGDAVPALVALLRTSGEPSGVYSAAAEALGRIGPAAKSALPELKGLLKHPAGHVRVNAAYALWLLDRDPAGADELASLLGHRHGRTRGYAAEALWFIHMDKQSLPALIHLLDEYDPACSNQQYIAARALGRIGPPAKAALPALRRLLLHPDIDLVATARGAIKRIQSGEN